jgi:hypothetical protein
MKENILLREFIYNIYTDNFAEAEKSLRSVVEEKIKNRMKIQMQRNLEENN